MNKSNRLSNATSPYLKQHANNPVDWYPWGDEAIAKARQENKPILLSIGYAACHWCHVMAHESFEDPATAEMMNEHFVNIKVDREERPDLDKIYQTAHYFLTRRNGGWPLTVFLTPDDLTSFFSGTYFPLQPKYQLPSFKEVLLTIKEIYQKNLADIKKQNRELTRILNTKMAAKTTAPLNDQPLGLALQNLQQDFDKKHGGFGGAPKFPQAAKLAFLLHMQSPLASTTLTAMARGGIYDQLGGGFFRYTVDEKWRIPHFEKMLYDNAQLLTLYSIAARDLAEPFYSEIADETAQWIMTTMQSVDGGYYASLDADSAGGEGLFYIWNKIDIEKLLTEDEFRLIRLFFGLEHEPNFEKHWHFYQDKSLEAVATQIGITLETAKTLFITARKKLNTARETRVRPACDNKILTSWNGLMIKAMVNASETLQKPALLQSARKALAHLQKNAWHNNQLMVSTHSSLPGYLDDYAFLLDALITLLQSDWRTEDLNFAIELADKLIANFTDTENGGFYFTSHTAEKILFRPKNLMDEAIPSANGIAAQALLILGHLLGETRYLTAAENTLKSAANAMNSYPAEHCSLLLGLKEFLRPSQIIVIRGPAAECKTWQQYANNQRGVTQHVFAIPDGETGLPGLLAARKPAAGTCAYICKGFECLSTINDFAQFKEISGSR